MYLKKLHISNFRCFRDYTIEFAPGVTVLFGKNGSGKTTLIHAIHKALSFAFKKDKKRKENTALSAGFADLRPNNFSRKEDIVRDEKTGFPFPDINIHAEACYLGTDLNWDMYASTSTFKLQDSKYKDAYYLLMDTIQHTDTYPVFAYFSDSFPHVSNKASGLSKTQLSLRNLGYLGWDAETDYSDLWIKRFAQTWTQCYRADQAIDIEKSALRNCDSFLKKGMVNEQEYREDVALHEKRLSIACNEKQQFDAEVSAIRECLVKFTKGDPNFEVVDLFVSVYEEEGLCLDTTDNRNPSFEKLPAGYKRLLYMALDIAYRSYLLNGTTGAHGVVIIDEIDLHLHPELEQVVLQRFINTFPHIQFIVSTHSPLVLTGVETNKNLNVVLKMTLPDNAPEVWPNIHGIDYNQMLEENMGVSKRKPEIEALFEKAWKAVAAKDTEAAKKTVAELETVTPQDQTELVKLRAVISRIEIIGR